jgi:ACR3 family arsenite efflux pump ArsB
MEGHNFEYALPLMIAAVVGCVVAIPFCLAGPKTISTLSQSSNLLVAGAIMVFGVASVLGLSAYSGDMLNISVWLRAVGEMVREF